MFVTTEVKQQVINRLEQAINIANKELYADITMPSVIYTKGGTTAGTANYQKHQINLNPTLLMQNVETFLQRTVPHEMAHLITGIAYPATKSTRYRKGSPHGPEWKYIMKLIGAEPSRCHNYDVSSVKRKKSTFEYICSGCKKTVTLGPKRHKKQQQYLARGLNAYSHGACGRNYKLSWIKPTTQITQPAEKSQQNKQPKKTKKELANQIYLEYNLTHDKTFIINKFILDLKMTKAGANTYYNNARNHFN